MNGILNVNKPIGITSFDVIARLRKILKLKKIGHTGTLDPDATGVLPICVGKATGAVEFLIDKDKHYRASIKLGVETDTGDASGKHISVKAVACTKEDIIRAILSFKGKIMQTPPMYSALKVDGRKLCDLARAGITIDRVAREVEIYDISVASTGSDFAVFEVSCSKGTYIRTLCEDIGKILGCGAHMSGLTRISAGNFKIEDSLTLEEIKELTDSNLLQSRLIPVDKVFDKFIEVRLDEYEKTRFLNGVIFALSHHEKYQSELILRVYHENQFLGLGSIVLKEKNFLLKSRKLFI